MGKIIPKHKIEQIRDANDIVEVVGSYIQLKRAGSSYKALCPFHKEKTPSFNVNAHRQIFHCFGCGAGGDVFRFVMDYEGVDFGMAARLLAERSGVHLEYEEGSGADRSRKETLYKVHEEAAAFFHRVLLETTEAKPARDYLAQRDISEEIIAEFLFGYAPKRRNTMRTFAQKHGFTLDDLKEAGLVAEPEQGRPYDRFRERIMIPIRDQLGRVIAFTGRVLRDDQPGGKYVNSPETMLFHKSRVLFALDKARRFIVDERRAIVCEGQIDAIRCHQAGIQTVVASQGTALTADHARLLKRYADAVVFVLDPDEAGENAALRSAEHFLQAGLGLYAVTLPEGTDPDTMICNEGPDAFRALVEKAESIVEFTVSVMRRREDINTETGLMRASRAVLEIVRHTPSAVRRDQYLQAAADKLGLREQALREDLRRLTQPRRRKPREEPADPEREHTVRPPEEIALLETLIAHPEQSALIKEYLPLSTFRDPDCRQLVELLLEHEDDPDFNLTTATTEDGALVRLAARVQAEPRAIHDGDMTPEKAVQDMILVMRRKALEREREALRKRMRTAGEEEQKQLRVQCTQIVYDMNRFKQGWEEALPLLEL